MVSVAIEYEGRAHENMRSGIDLKHNLNKVFRD